VGIALLLRHNLEVIKERLRVAVGRREKLTREQVIEEGIQCAAPEGSICAIPNKRKRRNANLPSCVCLPGTRLNQTVAVRGTRPKAESSA